MNHAITHVHVASILHLRQLILFNNPIIMFIFNIITAEQPSVDHIGFTMECYGQVSDYHENFPINSMLTTNNRCCSKFTSLLNNHINELNRW